MTVEIPLTRGYVALVDDDDADIVNGYRSWWAQVREHGTVYARSARYGPGDRRGVSVLMHRLILGVGVGVDVDHINGNGIDNRRCNLRRATKSQNLINRPAPRTNTSGFKGVSWHKQAERWAAQIMHETKPHHIGLFMDKAEAARAYDEAALRLHGKFARLNFPKEESRGQHG